MCTRKREHSRKPDEQYELIEELQPGAAPGAVRPWVSVPSGTIWGNQADESYVPTWSTYGNHSRKHLVEVTAD